MSSLLCPCVQFIESVCPVYCVRVFSLLSLCVQFIVSVCPVY